MSTRTMFAVLRAAPWRRTHVEKSGAASAGGTGQRWRLAKVSSSPAVQVGAVEVVNLNPRVEGEVAQLRRKIGSGVGLHDSPRAFF